MTEIQLIHKYLERKKKRSRLREKITKLKSQGKNEKKQSSRDEGINVIVINKYLLFTRHKAKKAGIERGKSLRSGKQVIIGDSAFSLNTRSKVKAIQAHRCWLFPNSHRTHKTGWEEKPPAPYLPPHSLCLQEPSQRSRPLQDTRSGCTPNVTTYKGP